MKTIGLDFFQPINSVWTAFQIRYSFDNAIAALLLVSARFGAATILTRFAKKNGYWVRFKIDMLAEPIDFPPSHYLIYSPPNNSPKRFEVEIFKT